MPLPKRTCLPLPKRTCHYPKELISRAKELPKSNIVVKETDKGGAVVVMTKDYCHEMVMEHPRDTGTYIEADVENPDKRVLEIVKEHADENTPNIPTAKENEYIHW